MQETLPKALKELVKKTVSILGEVIKEEGGNTLYNQVEKIRKEMVDYRSFSQDKQYDSLQKLYRKLNSSKTETQHVVAHSFTLLLELINTCETAYRTFRLQESKAIFDLKKQENTLVYVLTAHPTEARTTENIELFHRIHDICVRILNKSGEEDYLLSIIKHNLKLAWLLPATLHEKPRVVDEANHLFSIVLRQDIFDVLLRANRDLGTVRVRTWVGGDKDGHPGVDEKVMVECLQASRNHFVHTLGRILGNLEKDIHYTKDISLIENITSLKCDLKNIAKIKDEDAKRVIHFKQKMKKISDEYTSVVGADSPRIKKILSIIELFPGFVIPIEIREDSEIIAEALKAKSPMAITRMLQKLALISKGGSVRCYAQSMIISMCNSYDDILNAKKLVQQCQKEINLPIVPLFETAEALDKSVEIVKKVLADKEYLKKVKDQWNNNLEIMLGYSDSSKGMGVLASRISIARALRQLDELITSRKFNPVFFHGSGGSVDRGGGNLKEQTAWWPMSALKLYKATIQGEMVERSFSSPEVTLSGMQKILSNFDRAKARSGEVKINKIITDFSAMVEKRYVDKIHDENFFRMVEAATPYSYLNVLKLGSRPTKRAKAKSLDFKSIRAIPWVLCWTQTRVLFPTWWGVGASWKELSHSEIKKKALIKSFQTSDIFSSYVRVLGFTLSKVDLAVFKLYLSQSSLEFDQQIQIFDEFKKEYMMACDFVRTLSGQKNLLWFRPWLCESIRLRSSMIHPLNILQIIGSQNKDEGLVRKSVAGVSSGMLTTG